MSGRTFSVFGERLKEMRLERKMSKTDFAAAVGVSTVTVTNWESGQKKPAMDAIVAMSSVLQVSVDLLLGINMAAMNDQILLTPAERELVLDFRVLDRYGKRAVKTACSLEKRRMDEMAAEKMAVAQNIVPALKVTKRRDRYIPCYTTPAAAGYSVPLDGRDFEMVLVDSSVPAQADYAVTIQGNSMYPYIKDGDIVYVEKTDRLQVGDAGIFCVDGAMYCKQYYVDTDRNLLLVSANSEYRDSNVFVPAESGSTVSFLGKVLLGERLELPDYLFEE